MLAYSQLPLKSEFIWECNAKVKDLGKCFEVTLWIDIWKLWVKLNYKEPTTSPEIYNQVICFNSQITGQTFYYVHSMYQVSISHLKDVYNKDSKQLYEYAEILVIVPGTYNYLEYY